MLIDFFIKPIEPTVPKKLVNLMPITEEDLKPFPEPFPKKRIRNKNPSPREHLDLSPGEKAERERVLRRARQAKFRAKRGKETRAL